MIPVLLAAIGAFAFVLLMRILWAKTQPKVSTTVIVIAASVFIGTLVILTASGRFHPLAAVGAAILPFLKRGLFLLRLSPMLSSAFRMFQSNASNFQSNSTAQDTPNVSEAETPELKMTLNHETGAMTGTVKFGEFRSRELSSMTAADVVKLYRSLEDEQSRRLMVSFIERYHPNLDQEESSTHEPPRVDDSMTTKKAREILGVDESATVDDIINAHRRIIQRLHPDRGGSSFLAAQINDAKRILLEQMK